MSRGKSRKARRRKTVKAGKKLNRPQGTEESASSKAYEEGKTWGYNYRINGPTFPVNITHQTTNDM